MKLTKIRLDKKAHLIAEGYQNGNKYECYLSGSGATIKQVSNIINQSDYDVIKVEFQCNYEPKKEQDIKMYVNRIKKIMDLCNNLKWVSYPYNKVVGGHKWSNYYILEIGSKVKLTK